MSSARLGVDAARSAGAAGRERRADRRRVPARRQRPRVGRARRAAAACGGARWPACAARSSRSSRRCWAGSCPPGTASAAICGRRPDRLREVVAQLEGVALPVAAIESDMLPARVPGYRPDSLDLACAGRRAGVDRRRPGPGAALPARERAAAAHPVPRRASIRSWTCWRGARADASSPTWRPTSASADRAVLADLWELVWAGLVTNDAWEPLRDGTTLRSVPRRRARCAGRGGRDRPRRSRPLAAAGRWWRRCCLPAATPGERARALAEVLLDRHGVVTRAAVLAEGVPGGFTAVYGELRAMEEAGRVSARVLRRGPGRRPVRATGGRRAAARPARGRSPSRARGAGRRRPRQPLRRRPRPGRTRLASRPGQRERGWRWSRAGRPSTSRRAAAGWSRSNRACSTRVSAALAAAVAERRIRRITPERIDGRPIHGDPAEQILLNHGFLQTHRRLVLR